MVQEAGLHPANSPIRRERTAMHRYACSRPIALATASGIIGEGRTVLDYGCGRGADVRYLQQQKVRAVGWDPHYEPNPGALRPADIVNLGFVLNVIEDPRERADTLRRAFELATRALLVSVRVKHEVAEGAPYGDGIVTAANTFQKLFDQAEFLAYLESQLGVRPYAAAIGIAVVFRDSDLEQSFVSNQVSASRTTVGPRLLHAFEVDPAAQEFTALATRLGRMPLGSEFAGFEGLSERYGSVGRLRRLLLRNVDPAKFEPARVQRRGDVLTVLGALRLKLIRPTLASLSDDLREDIKAFWPSLAEAKAEAEKFLFSLGRPEAVAASCAVARVGKKLPEDLYVHKTAEEELPALLRLMIFAAHQIVGEVEYDLAKLSTDGRKVSFLSYPTFEKEAHPELRTSIRVYLPKSDYEIRDFSTSLNPPILHRKETFVSETHPRRPLFSRLTASEERQGLLSEPSIGHRQQWQDWLTKKGYVIKGHRLVPLGRKEA